MDNTELMTTWCRMWSEDPALAHETMTDTAVQWSGQTGGLDTVVGPAEQERFVTAYRAQHVNVFTPRVLVDGGDAFAYTWDVARPDGSVWTGLDLNLVEHGLISENWTFVAPRRCESPDPGPEPAPGEQLDDVARRWLRLRAGETALSRDLMDPDALVHLGTEDPADHELRGPGGAVELVGAQHDRAVTLHRRALVDPSSGRIALLWSGDDGIGGADLLATSGGRVTHVWSMTATRPFRY